MRAWLDECAAHPRLAQLSWPSSDIRWFWSHAPEATRRRRGGRQRTTSYPRTRRRQIAGVPEDERDLTAPCSVLTHRMVCGALSRAKRIRAPCLLRPQLSFHALLRCPTRCALARGTSSSHADFAHTSHAPPQVSSLESTHVTTNNLARLPTIYCTTN